MRFIIDVDTVVFDIAPLYYRAHCDAAAALGWSHLDPDTFRRVYRKSGPGANLLPGAKPAKVQAYERRFIESLETPEKLRALRVRPESRQTLERLAALGSCSGITLGVDIEARADLLRDAGLLDLLDRLVPLNPDPRRRPGELSLLADGDPRAVVVSASDAVCRTAAAADLFVVGISSGMCGKTRLYQSGVTVVYAHLIDFYEALANGADDLIRAGLLP